VPQKVLIRFEVIGDIGEELASQPLPAAAMA
jgi:hypothetical protein